MKKIFITFLFTSALTFWGQAALWLDESFPYAAGNLNGQGGWSSGSACQVSAGSLTYPGLLSPASPSNKVALLASAGTALKSFSGTPVTSGSVYLSFLFKQTTLAASTTGGTVAGLDDDGTVSTSSGRVAAALGVHVKQTNASSYVVGIRKAQGASGAGGGTEVFYPGGTFAAGDVVFIVAKYTFGAGAGDDTVTLWVNPGTNTFNGSEPVASVSATNTGNTTDALQLQYVFTRANSSTTSGVNEIDDLRVGSTWAEVTPSGGVPPSGAGNEPRITESFRSAGALILRGTNGPAGGVYQVLSSQNLATPIGGWPAIATNLFDGNGNFDSTNPVALGDPQRFYRILVGGTIIPPPGEAPQITTPPTNVTVITGQSASFSTQASGTAPLAYQWFFNTNTPLATATNAVLNLTNVQAVDAGTYSVRVTNTFGSVTSAGAVLTVLAAPSITTQPANQFVVVSNSALFSVTATGAAPLHYQWYFNTNTPLSNATNASYSISTTLTNNAGGYSVIVTNGLGAVTSIVATLTVAPASTNPPNYNLFGFAQATTGGGQILETDPAYVKVYTALDFANAVRSANKTAGSVKVIEIMNDLNLGWNEVGAPVQGLDSNPFREHATPKLHPVLIASGVSIIDIKSKSGLTIFSANGSTIRHANLNIKDTSNIIIRNLKFAELWEWDEATKGDYDSNDWDFITIGNGGGTVFNVWIDHCTFTKAYDGACDMKGGCYNITFSWNKYMGDDGATNPNSFVRQQLTALEANKSAYPMYNFLRTHGFSFEDIATISQGHDKTHLIGATSLNAENAQHAVTFHHQWYLNPWDRLPRLRAGNVHNYNIYVDDAVGLAAKRLRDSRVAAMSPADQTTFNNNYKFQVFLNGSISTEDGAVLVENSVYVDCLTPLRNNQTDPLNPVYTGKILALDTIYHFDNADTTTIDYRGSSTNAPGDIYLGPVQAPVKPFSWNGFSTLPYPYVLDDPADLVTILTNSNYGAGAGVLSWGKTNWLKSSY